MLICRMKSFHLLLVLFISCCFGLPHNSIAVDIQRVEPSHWWTGMKNKELQLLFFGKRIGGCTVSLSNGGANWKLLRTHRTSNPDYLFADVEISPSALPGTYTILFLDEKGKKAATVSYELKAKSAMAEGAAGYTAADVLYLIMPDRFSNGNPSNDGMPGMLEKPDRNNPSGRHGGDLQGIENHLDYLKDLGVSTLWLNPVLENNQPKYSYHGYAITDYYKTDSRFGGLEDYKRLIRKCHSKGLKMVQDMVANHIGTEHYWMKSIPDSGWIHYAGKEFTRCNFRIETIADPHAAAADRELMTDGWFDNHMADLNQRHPMLAKYLIQNTLWWIAETGIDGIRMDTWPYNDKEFMSRWCREVKAEFPAFAVVGEVWVDQPAFAAYFTGGVKNQDGYVPSLPSCTDFPFYFALIKGLSEKGSWDSGLQRIYNAVSQDFLYKDASRNLIFADNHDLSRFITTQSGDFRRFRQGMAMLLTMRGIPQLYYGGEFATSGDAAKHSDVRLDFPGGWPGDKENYFETSRLTGRADSAYKFMQALLKWRKSSKAVAEGEFIHFLPQDNVYAFLRKHKDEQVLVLVNGNEDAKSISLSRFGFGKQTDPALRDVLGSAAMLNNQDSTLEIKGRDVVILEWKK